MRARSTVVLAAAVLLAGAAWSQEAPGISVGAPAPTLEGKKWFTPDGQAPETKGKVYLADFWFAG